MARLVSLGILILLILFLGATFYQVVAPFLLPLFLAGVVAIIFQPVYRRFLRWTGDRIGVSAALTTAAAVLAFLIPLALGIFFATGELLSVAREMRSSQEFQETLDLLQEEPFVRQIAHNLQPILGRKINEEQLTAEIENGLHDLIAEIVRKTLGMAGGAALSLLGNSVRFLISLGMFLIALFYFLADSPRLIAATEKLIPVQIDYQRQLYLQFERAVRAVVVSTFFAAIAQGIFTAVALYFFGFERFFLLLFLATFASMIPLAGAWLVWLPCAGWLLYTGHWGQALSLSIYGALVVGTLDNVVRTYILHTDVKLHPLLAFISVLGGVQVMGLWGVFVAPIVASCLHALVQIVNTELKELSQTRLNLRRKGSKPSKPVEETPATLLPTDQPTAATSTPPTNREAPAPATLADSKPAPAPNDSAQQPASRRSRRRSGKRR